MENPDNIITGCPQRQLKKTSLVPAALFISAAYWIYLIIVSQPMQIYDAVGYVSSGKSINAAGWGSYFLLLNREPLYPFFISMAMKVSSWTGIFWEDVLKTQQFSLLLITQLLLLRLLRILKINEIISVATVLYFGFSPAVLNSALSIYSEILTYPLTLGTIYLTLMAWQAVEGHSRHAWALGCALAAAFILMTFVKSIFYYIFPFYALIFIFKALSVNRMTLKPLFFSWIKVILAFVVTYYAAVECYKMVNYHFNGNFSISAQSQFGPWNFYGNAVRRSEPLSNVEKLAALAAVPGEEYCNMVYGGSTCYLWSLMKSDEIAMAKRKDLAAKGFISPDRHAFSLSFQNIQKNPAQYLLLTFLEGCKMVFWESTHIGFVYYPDWLRNAYDNLYFSTGLTFMSGLLTLAGLICVTLFVLKKIKGAFVNQVPADGSLIILCFSLLLVFVFSASYAVLFIIKRYLFPLVPLFLIFIAFGGQTCLNIIVKKR